MKQNVAVMQLNSTVPALVAWVLRQRAEMLKQCAPKQSRKLYKRALRIARFATWISRFWPRLGPSAYRELALLEAARGKLKLALRHIRSSCRIAEKQGTTFEYAQSLRVQGEIENQLGDSAGPANVARGECELERIREAVRQVRRELRC